MKSKNRYVIVIEAEDGDVRICEFVNLKRAVSQYKTLSCYPSIAVRLMQVVLDYDETV